ncbi:MAG TPA: hypothetical protein VF723_01810 [Pyrinomonadaceae bacterium]|jgi:hypothetical protein
MRETHETISCERAEDLVAYLYGEAEDAGAAVEFENHLRDCAACRAELSAFAGVRELVGQWRRQSLGALVSPALQFETSPASSAPEKRSALAALRQFFTLSPAWMRAATVSAALLFCVLAVIAIAHFKAEPATVVVEKVVQTGISQAELEAGVEEARRQERAAAPIKQSTQLPGTRNASAGSNRQRPANRPSEMRTALVAATGRTPRLNARSSPPRATQLASADPAAELPFTASNEEQKLPRLYDLVEDSN